MADFQRKYQSPEKLGIAVSVSGRETPMDIAERHVRRGEDILAGQILLIGRLRERGLPTNTAEQLLAQCQRSQNFHVSHLSKIRGQDISSAAREQEDCFVAPEVSAFKKINKTKLKLPASWEKHVKKDRTVRLQFKLSDVELAAVNDWRFKTRMPSQASAIRLILKRGLSVGK